MKNGLKNDRANQRTSSGFTPSRNYSISPMTLYSEILLLVKAGKRKWTDEPWQFQLSLSTEMNIEATLEVIHNSLVEARETEQKILMKDGVPAR
jgi:hypothetical protein